jgi:hypothetical protein
VTSSVTPDAIQITTRTTEYTFGSFLTYDTTFKVILAIWRLPRYDEQRVLSALANLPAMKSIEPASAPIHKVTYCACGRDGQHYSELVLDTVLLGTPKRIYKLMFASETLRRFMRENQKLEGKSRLSLKRGKSLTTYTQTFRYLTGCPPRVLRFTLRATCLTPSL